MTTTQQSRVLDSVSLLVNALAAGGGIRHGGRRRAAADGRTFPVEDPATGQHVASVSDGRTVDATAAVGSEAVAFAGWSRTSPRVRSEVLRREFALMVARSEEPAGLIALENGKVLPDARRGALRR